MIRGQKVVKSEFILTNGTYILGRAKQKPGGLREEPGRSRPWCICACTSTGKDASKLGYELYLCPLNIIKYDHIYAHECITSTYSPRWTDELTQWQGVGCIY